MNYDEVYREAGGDVEEGEGFSMGALMYSIFFENPISKYLIGPPLRLTGRALSYIIPDMIKNIPSSLYRKIAGTYGSEDFVNGLLQLGVLKENCRVNFAHEYFQDAVEEAHREKKTLLLLFGSLSDTDNIEFFTQLFDSEEIKQYLT